MASKSKNNRTVILEADRPRVLRAGHKALKMIEKMTKQNLEDLDVGGDFEVLEKVVYCLMLKDAQKNGEKLTLDMMEDILEEVESEQDIVDAVAEAFRAAFPGNPHDVKNKAAATTPEA